MKSASARGPRTTVLSCLARSLVFVLLIAGCSRPEPYLLGPPDGWSGEGSRWWKSGTDTVGQFRNLESLEAMGVLEDRLAIPADRLIARQREIREEQLARAARASLVALFRHQPEVVDSLFQRFVRPGIAEVDLEAEPRELLERLKKTGYRTLSRHFREPRAVLRLGRDVAVAYPDSLRERGVRGAVRMQVFLNDEGEPMSLWLLEPLHPILDDIAMKAVTEVRWQPAYLYRRGKASPIASWVRYGVQFRKGTD